MKRHRAFIAAQVEEGARDVTALGSPLVLLLIVLLMQPDAWRVALAGLVAVETAGRLIKLALFTPRPRPAGYDSLLEKSNAGSFPSIHAARSAFVFLTLFREDHRVLLVQVVVLVLPVLVGATRLVLGQHRWWDVAAGLAIGATFALALTPALQDVR